MASIASLGRAVSGLQAAQRGLQVTGHNLTNTNTVGYTRQQLLQGDSSYLNIGSGGKLQQVGLGVSMTEIRQIRDEFADRRYRTENSVLNYYTVMQSGISEVEAILDEPHGESLSNILEQFWSQTQKLSTNPNGVEERMAFLQTAKVFTEKANHIMNSLTSYQAHLNDQVKSSVKTINTLLNGINELNTSIAKAEINGDRANDLRDQRNVLLDELSSYVDVSYEEQKDGRLRVKIEGQLAVDQGFVRELALVQTEPMSALVEPVWKDTETKLYPLNTEINAVTGNDMGTLKSLLVTRGRDKADANTDWKDIALNDNKSVDVQGNEYLIPRMQKELDILIQEITKVVNDALDGEGIGAYEGVSGVPVFVPIASAIPGEALPKQPVLEDFVDDPEGYKAAMEDYNEKIKPHLVVGNIQVNPLLLENGGYNRLGTVSVTADVGDNQKVIGLLEEWTKNRTWHEGDDVNAPPARSGDFASCYAEIVSELGRKGYEAKGKVSEKNTVVTSTDNDRKSISAVSTDEEFSFMLKYQHAYNASARMITMLDGMMDTIINRM